MPSWVVLHENAHAMTSTHDGGSDGHGPAFVGIYVSLVVRSMHVGEDSLLAPLRSYGIRAQRDARPVSCDCASA